MSDDPRPIDLSDWKIEKPATRKRRVVNPVAQAAESTKLADKTVEEISEMAIRRAANVFILGGDDMLPKSGSEASNIAKTWADVARLDKARRMGQPLTELEEARKFAEERLAYFKGKKA